MSASTDPTFWQVFGIVWFVIGVLALAGSLGWAADQILHDRWYRQEAWWYLALVVLMAPFLVAWVATA